MDVQPETENYFSQLNANEDRVREALNAPGGDPNRKQIDYAIAIWKTTWETITTIIPNGRRQKRSFANSGMSATTISA